MKAKWQEDPLFELEELKDKIAKPRTLAEYMPKVPAVDADEPVKIDRQQQLNIAKITWILDQKGKAVHPDAIFNYWPTSPSMRDKAGKRPTLLQIQRWMLKPKYAKDLEKLGMKVNQDESSLTAEQIMCLQYVTDPSSTKSFHERLKDLGIKPVTYRSWMRQKEFNEMIKRMSANALADSMPIAEAQLAAGAQAGDLKYIKFAMEVTGRHDPARQQQVDTQALIGVIIDTVQEVFSNDPDKLREFASLISIRAKGVRGVIQQ